MKPTSKAFFYVTAMVTAVILACPGRSYSQDSTGKNHHKTMILKIQDDKNGKKTILDTTINLDQVGDVKDLKEFMRKYDVDLRDLDESIGEMNINISNMELPDSVGDSLRNFTKNITIIGKNGKNFHYQRNTRPERFDYNFDFDLPEPPEAPERPELGFFNEFPEPGMAPRIRSFNGRGETLSDLLGDIPLSNVKHYSIKERKNGKRIIIDLSNDPVFEKQERVVIIREPRRPMPPGERGDSRHDSRKQFRKKVIIDEEKQ